MELLEIINNIFEPLNLRERDVLFRRFGFQGNKETLEDLALDYNVSRERIRQIQESALRKIKPLILQERQVNEILEYSRKLLLPIGLCYEKSFFKLVNQKFQFNDRDLKIFKFLIISSQKIIFHQSDELFHNFYALEDKIYQLGRHLLKKIYFHFLETNEIYPEEKILSLTLKEIKRHLKINPDFSDLIDFLKILKHLGKNPFNFWGLKSHNFITPQCLKDKIYLTLKLENRPMHFREIYQRLHQLAQVDDELIHYFWHRRYNLSSIKNELIKHPDFVLVSRGTYALKEWGFIGGTAKELILEFLKKEKKIRKEKLWQIISELRPIKKSSFTIYLNEIKNLRQEDGYLIYHD